MNFLVRLHNGPDVTEKRVPAGASLYELIVGCGIMLDAPCGGKGRCGKCRVLAKGCGDTVSADEKRLLGDYHEKGYRLACFVKVYSDLDIFTDDEKRDASILTSGRMRTIETDPLITKRYYELAPPSIDDQLPDFKRIVAASGQDARTVLSADILRELPAVIRKNGFRITGVYMDGELISVESGDTRKKHCGIAFDIGTTTVAAYLYDLSDGKMLGVSSMINPQNKHGADVVSRIGYSTGSYASLQRMRSLVLGCIDALTDNLAQSCGIDTEDIYLATFAGNTVMMHLMMGIPPANIAMAPFIPVTTSMHILSAGEAGIGINRFGYAAILPCVSAYIGADTVAAVISTGLYESEKLTLLVDIGTNGEIVLGNRDRMIACSAAAGPAFEGANITDGTGGVEGAIDKVSFKDEITYTTISGKEAIGICGSGIIDAIAGMLDKGIINGTGRLLYGEEASHLTAYYSARLTDSNGMRAFRIAESSRNIIITQKDIREIQNAKAAIHAGITVLARNYGADFEDIDRVCLAGGFGTNLDITSALRIGLLPSALEGRIEPVGNAAGSGAVEVLLSRRILSESVSVADRMEYLELSALPEFSEEYVNCMVFQEV